MYRRYGLQPEELEILERHEARREDRLPALPNWPSGWRRFVPCRGPEGLSCGDRVSGNRAFWLPPVEQDDPPQLIVAEWLRSTVSPALAAALATAQHEMPDRSSEVRSPMPMSLGEPARRSVAYSQRPRKCLGGTHRLFTGAALESAARTSVLGEGEMNGQGGSSAPRWWR